MPNYPPDFASWWLTMRDWLRFCKRACPDKAGSLREWKKLNPTPELAAMIVKLARDKAKDYIVATSAGEFREQPKAPVRWLKAKPWLDQESDLDKAKQQAREYRDLEPLIEQAVNSARGLGWFDSIACMYPSTIRLAGKRLADSMTDGMEPTVEQILDAARARAATFS